MTMNTDSLPKEGSFVLLESGLENPLGPGLGGLDQSPYIPDMPGPTTPPEPPPPDDGVDPDPDPAPPTKDTKPAPDPKPDDHVEQPQAPDNQPVGATQEEIAQDADYWRQRILNEGSGAFMDAIRAGDPSAKNALKDPAFLWMLQQTVKEENELITLVSNLLDIQHRNAMASIQNIRA